MVDTPDGECLIGKFWWPRRIYADLAVLRTLPPREFAKGMAEVVKIAAVRNVNIFEVLETHSHEIRAALFGKVIWWTKTTSKPKHC